jgi:SRSO17 transposase
MRLANTRIIQEAPLDLVTSFVAFVQELGMVMTAPTFQNFVSVLGGWVFARRRTITGALVAGGLAGKRHHAAFHRLFATAVWSLDALGLALFRMIEPLLPADFVLVAIDDTLARKRGLKVFGVGMHHDPLLSSRGKAITNWGHSWVVLGVIVQFPLWPGRAFCLPLLFRLYLNKAAAKRDKRAYRSRPELAVEMLRVLCGHRKNRRFHAIADSAYGGQSVLCELPSNCELTSRLVMDARLYEPPPPRRPGVNGRPRKRGQRLPTPEQMLEARATRLTLDLYGRHDQARVAEAQGCVHKAPDRLLKIVAVEPLTGGRKKQAFYSTCANASALQILSWYALRWSMEVTFHDSKMHLGFEEPQGWTRQAVQRTAPIAMVLYSLIVVWFAEEGHRHHRPLLRPWYTTKSHPTFTDMLATLRRESLREHIYRLGLGGPGSRKIMEALENTAALAA